MQQDLFELRRSRDIEQQALAQYMGVHKATLSQIERGRTDLSLTRAKMIAEFLNVSLDDVYKAAEETRRRWEAKQERAHPNPLVPAA